MSTFIKMENPFWKKNKQYKKGTMFQRLCDIIVMFKYQEPLKSIVDICI